MSGAVAVLIAVVSGLVGVLVRNAYERGADLRTRQLQAADDFLATAIPTLDDVDRSTPGILARFEEFALRTHGAKPPDVALGDLDVAARALELHLARIDLLFGSRSDAATTARALTLAIKRVTGMLGYCELLPGSASDQHDGCQGPRRDRAWLARADYLDRKANRRRPRSAPSRTRPRSLSCGS